MANRLANTRPRPLCPRCGHPRKLIRVEFLGHSMCRACAALVITAIRLHESKNGPTVQTPEVVGSLMAHVPDRGTTCWKTFRKILTRLGGKRGGK